MEKSKRIAIMASSLMFITGIACGATFMSTGHMPDTTATVSADDCVYNGLIYITGKDNKITITGYVKEADLVNLVIPDEIEGKPVTSISDKAFYGCTAMKTLVMGKNVTSVGSYAFAGTYVSLSYNYVNLSEITIPDNLEAIGENAFQYVKIKKLNVPASTTFIPDRFISDTSLEDINVSTDNKKFSSDKGILYSSDQTTLIKCPCSCTQLSYTISDKTTEITDNAFKNCSQITKIVIGNNVETIGDYAFYCCLKLSDVVMGKNVTSIGDYAFAGACIHLTDYYMNFSELTIPDNIEVLGEKAFDYVKINKLNVSDSVTSVPDVFYNNASLKEISVDEANKIFSSDKGILYSADKSKLIRCPKNTSLISYTVNENTNTICDYAFSKCTGITKIDMGNGVTSIGNYALYNSLKLSNVIIGKNVTSIGDYAFAGACIQLTDYYMNFSELTLPDNIEILGEKAFDYVKINKLNVPASVTSVSDIFYNNASLTEISVDEGNKAYSSEKGILFSADKSKLIRCPKNTSLISYTVNEKTNTVSDYAFSQCNGIKKLDMGNGVTSIGNYALYRSFNITNVIMGKNVTSIGDYAFAGACIQLSDYYMNFSELTIPDNIEVLGEKAFDHVNISKLSIPDSVTSVLDIFYNNASLTEITVSAGNKNYCSDKGILYTGDRSKLIKCPASSALLTYDISDSTTQINNSAFKNAKIQTIFIPASVKAIEADAFTGSKLTKIKGITGSYAQTYATENKFTFVPTEPAAVTTAPVVTTKPPVVTTKTPVVTTPPVKTTTVPVTTAPPKTTSAPVTSAVKPKFTYDVNGDGKINIMDIMYLKKYILNSK